MSQQRRPHYCMTKLCQFRNICHKTTLYMSCIFVGGTLLVIRRLFICTKQLGGDLESYVAWWCCSCQLGSHFEFLLKYYASHHMTWHFLSIHYAIVNKGQSSLFVQIYGLKVKFSIWEGSILYIGEHFFPHFDSTKFNSKTQDQISKSFLVFFFWVIFSQHLTFT